MRRTRHVVLPVRSWRYIGLLIVSLACLTLGHVSRDREGRHGSLAGPELMHTAPHEVDACPNEDCTSSLAISDGFQSHLKPSDVATPVESRLVSVRSARVARDSRLNGASNRDADVTRLNQAREHRMSVAEKQVRSVEHRDARLVRSRSQESDTRRLAAERRVQSRDYRLRAQSVDRARITQLRRTRNLMVEPRIARDFRTELRVGTTLNRLDTRAERKPVNTEHQRRITENRLNSRADRRSVSTERRVRVVENRLAERRSASQERRVRAVENRLAERRSASQERRVRAVENRLAERRSTSEERRVRAVENRLTKRRSASQEQRVRAVDNRLAERRSTSQERQIQLAGKQEVRETAMERRVRDIRAGRRLTNTEHRVRSIEKQLFTDRRSASDKIRQIRLAENRDYRSERRIRSPENRLVRHRSTSEERRVRDARVERRSASVDQRIRLSNSQRERDSMSNRHFATEERRMRITENRRIRDARFVREQRKPNDDIVRRMHLTGDVAGLERRHVRSASDVRANENRKFSLLNRQERSVESIRALSGRREASRLAQHESRRDSLNRDNRLTLIQSHKQREISRLNRRARSTDNMHERRVVREESRNIAEANRRSSTSRREILNIRRASENSGFVRKNRMTSSETGHPTQSRTSEKMNNEARRERHIGERIKRANVKTDLMRDIRMKAIPMNSQYLKNVMPSNNLNYEILRQAIVIALCAIYGASIFNGKSGPFRSLAEYGNQLAVW